jgi:hypothetical protein
MKAGHDRARAGALDGDTVMFMQTSIVPCGMPNTSSAGVSW